MALPFIAGLVIGSGVALLFTKKDMLQKGVLHILRIWS